MSIQIDRRAFLAFAGAGIVAGCTQAAVARWVAGEQAVAQEFAVVAPELAALGYNVGTPISVDGVTVTIPSTAADLANLTSALGVASQVSQGQPILVKVEAYINAITPVIWPIVGPMVTAANPGVGLALGLIVASLPALEGLLNFAVDFGKTLLTPQAASLATLAPRSVGGALGRVSGALPPDVALDELIRRASGRP